jgi:mRNA interferase RelE/StbE
MPGIAYPIVEKGGSGCRLRIGDWRVIFIEDARSITVIGVGHRNEIYK